MISDIDKRRVIYDGLEEDDWKPCLWYVTEAGERIPLAAQGDLLVIAGDKKARKSLLIHVFALSRFPGISRSRSFGFELDIQDRPIMYFDTEQPRRRVKRNRNRYHQAAGLRKDDADFIHYSLKGMSAPNMAEFITRAIDEQMKVTPPGMVVIDQVADLVTSRDENDAPAASRVIDLLNIWTEKTDALFCVSIHTNRGGENTTGRMGSLVDKKTDCTLRLNIDDNWITTAKHVFSREDRMPEIRFNHTYNGFPQYIEEVTNKLNQI